MQYKDFHAYPCKSAHGIRKFENVPVKTLDDSLISFLVYIMP